MNKEIKLLAEVASLMVSDDPEHYRLLPDFVEKFAELIVWDCAKICEVEVECYNFLATPMVAKWQESASKQCAEQIRERFGVEE
jgi:hypothetical protein